MALRFDPGAYNSVFQAGQNREAERDKVFADSMAAIPQSFVQYGLQKQQADRQAMLDEYLKTEEERKGLQHRLDYGFDAPVSRASYDPTSGQVKPILKSNQKPSLVEQVMAFKKQRGVGPLTQGQQRVEDVRTQFGLPMGYTPGMKHHELYQKGQNAITPYQQAQLEVDRERNRITGQKEATKQAGIAEKEASLLSGQMTQADLIINKVDQALSKVSGWSAGFGSKMASIPTTDARDLQADMETIKANLGFQQLQEMRRSSPTGGALGNVSEKELAALQSAVASLDQAQDPEQLRRNLNEIKTRYQNWKNTVQQTDSGTVAPTNGPAARKIKVRNKQTGQTGTISEQYFNPQKYEMVQ
jgi:hypothetical protein